jgi:glutamine synthetase
MNLSENEMRNLENCLDDLAQEHLNDRELEKYLDNVMKEEAPTHYLHLKQEEIEEIESRNFNPIQKEELPEIAKDLTKRSRVNRKKLK